MFIAFIYNGGLRYGQRLSIPCLPELNSLGFGRYLPLLFLEKTYPVDLAGGKGGINFFM